MGFCQSNTKKGERSKEHEIARNVILLGNGIPPVGGEVKAQGA